jgi:hypothetical protein
MIAQAPGGGDDRRDRSDLIEVGKSVELKAR